ncbi:asparagine synthetase B family protein [Ovoidimarina sediminis]|uniref:asparagine synthetase B family protein n=1 Tax=Ovoidimarina sediminis TaxID=3079856 RepID=UPI002913F682|nr:asparagine synthase-related protein [Rhodophyticola sp. MJ-SS7]MDU8946160.1 asparagine synthase-related protein [Rhodophyticola sp. MJ-SS7]
MSGIAGIVDFAGRPVDPDELQGMLGIMDYRGPDGRGVWLSETVALGQGMLRTTPEAREAEMPLVSADGDHVLVMDGRVDNRSDLRKDLLAAGALLRTQADEALVLAAYRLWGAECVKRIDGDFALAIWDGRERKLFVARDRLGFKPFFYHWSGSRFYFASDIAALARHPEIPTEIDEFTVAQVIANDYVSNTHSIWTGISRLPPRQAGLVDGSGLTSSTYWDPRDVPDVRYDSQDAYVDHYRELLFDEVRRVSRTVGPLGCEVSGGLDSSAVFSVAHALEKDGCLLTQDLKGYTLRFSKGAPTDELAYVHAVSEHLGRPVREIDAKLPELDWYEAYARERCALPPWPNGAMHRDEYQAVQSDGCRVLLNGVGGDQWLAGSMSATEELVARKEWALLWQFLFGLSRAKGPGRAVYEEVRFGLYPYLPKRMRLGLRKAMGRPVHSFLGPACLSRRLRDRLEDAGRIQSPASGQSRWAGLGMLDNAALVHAKETMELMAALAGLELRSPLSARRLIEFSFAVPAARRRWDGLDRSIHRRALQGVLTDTVLKRFAKTTFEDVFDGYFPDLVCHSDWRRTGISLGWLDAPQFERIVASAANDAGAHQAQITAWNAFSCVRVAVER